MNTFNCFQAIAFYTLIPFVIMWLYQNNFTTWMYITSAVQVISYVVLSLYISDKSSK